MLFPELQTIFDQKARTVETKKAKLLKETLTEKEIEMIKPTVQEVETVKQTTQAPTTQEEIDSELISLGYADADYADYPTSLDRFVTVSSADGAYTFTYPIYFFKTAYYNPKDESYELRTVDDDFIVTITKEDAPVPNDPLASCNQLYNQLMPQLDSSASAKENDRYYEYLYKKVSDTGYVRCIVHGFYKDNLDSGIYTCSVCNSETMYTLTIRYITENQKTASYTPKGYLINSFYRGWSISGCTYQLRTYKQYMVGDEGSKK
ncbi:hypothetical protein P261_00358 [Lachnospiraceae bacterium TWA4]|nr:hypothetical protein P261_00358 [Lachnospiraceae bacterium TWA4]